MNETKLFLILVGLFLLTTALRMAVDRGYLNSHLNYCNPFLNSSCSNGSYNYSINYSSLLPESVNSDCFNAKIYSERIRFNGTLHYKNCRITHEEIVCFDKKWKEKCKIKN